MVTEKSWLPVLDLSQFPNAVVDVYIELPQTDAGSRCAGICAASIALADAGIPMKDLVSSVSVGLVGDKIVVDQDLIKLERFVSTPMKYVNIIGLLVNEEELRDLVKDAQNLSLDEYETLALERISSIWKSLQMLHYPWVGRLEICRIDLAHLYLFMDQIERKGGPIQIYRKKLKELENEFKHAQRKYPKIEDICERELIHLDKLLTLKSFKFFCRGFSFSKTFTLESSNKGMP